jgi:hypothetical protein
MRYRLFRRMWINAFPNWDPHGLRLDCLEPTQRERALAILEASLSANGFSDARTAMKLNAALGEQDQREVWGGRLDSLTGLVQSAWYVAYRGQYAHPHHPLRTPPTASCCPEGAR